jgi:radical SAM/Cys-rich protein
MSMTISLPIQSDNAFADHLSRSGLSLQRGSLNTLQINVGKMCNLACHHCHVEAGPGRKEIMTWDTMSHVLTWLDNHGPALGVKTIDLTGGAPEMNPHFRQFVTELRKRNLHVLDRSNLTILVEPGYEYLAQFLAEMKVEVVASLPCYEESNVDKQRGRGVFHDSIEALRLLNQHGYAQPGSDLRLDLVYNPTGYGLPPEQSSLEADYKRELADRFDIRFNHLFTITNMPIKRFEHALRRDGKYDMYMQKLINAHRDENVPGVMCRSLISIGWQGSVYDCDFNQMLQLPLVGPTGEEEHFVESTSRKLWDYTPADLIDRTIATGIHCFGCTAGAGSSCTGQLN